MFLIRPNLAEIWACTCKHQFGWYMSPSMQAYSVHAHKFVCSGKILCPERSGMLSQFHRYFDLSDPTQFGWDMGPCMQAHSVHACKLECSGQIMCSEKSGMFSWFNKYFDLSRILGRPGAPLSSSCRVLLGGLQFVGVGKNGWNSPKCLKHLGKCVSVWKYHPGIYHLEYIFYHPECWY